MNKIWLIASYNRLERQSLLKQLKEWGYTREEIVISTQTEKDYREYSEKWGKDAIIIYRPGTCASDNRNTLLDYAKDFDGQLIMCSDKVRGYQRLSRDGKKCNKVDTREEMERLLEYMVRVRDKLDGEIAGVYSVGNAFFMSHSIFINQLMLACFMIFKPHTKYRFAHQAKTKEDFEICCNVISSGGRVVRFNNVALIATFHTTGGSYEIWNAKGDAINEASTKYVLAKYPRLLKAHATRKNEVRYVGPSKKIEIKYE